MKNEIDGIKVGEYVRTKDGYIGKLVEYIPEALNYLKIDVGREIIHSDNSRDNFIYTRYGFQLKHSPNLIDIIEEGDYVNGKKVYSIGTICSTIGILTTINFTDGTFITDDMQIVDVVTKEQFESVSYKVKE